MAQARLSVNRLGLTNFRSYASVEIAVETAPVVMAGPNGAGKTNVLDAISLLSPGRGLRGARLGEHTRQGPSAASEALWAVAATITRGGESYDIGTGLVSAQGSERRQVRLNGAPASSSADLGDVVQMLWLTPAMDRLFLESASGRRKFLDRLVLGFDSTHARSATRYETAMRERARLLKFGPRDSAWLDGLEAEMTQAGIAMALARRETVARLNRALAERGGAFPAAQLSLEADIGAESLSADLARARMRDAEAGRTTVGPHLTDLAVRHTQKRSDARQCSTGEQKALLISIVLADARELSRARGGLSPILLLDEIVAHLDGVRRAALFEEILDLGAQAWMTGTDIEMFAPLKNRAQLFRVADSHLHASD
ncbi:MAG: DNA replication/repair protein RecF [Alphaproteobacteria bacterium]|nr:DNA replication/repair protein RecF [Alphaproteobacteria bacterium]MBV9693488.1 DNA replication/repair protein RecF [Alphaproteobacteria bacterium]